MRGGGSGAPGVGRSGPVKVKEVMRRDVPPLRGDADLREAACVMRELDLAAVPVVDREKVVGLLADRSIVVRVVARGRNPADVAVREAMTREVTCCYEDYTIEEAARVMRDGRIRHLLVLSRDGVVSGICSARDLVRAR